MIPVWPRLDDSGLPSWVRADLRALPMFPASADVGAVVGRPPAGDGSSPASSPRAGTGTRRARRHDASRLIAVVALAICVALLAPSILTKDPT